MTKLQLVNEYDNPDYDIIPRHSDSYVVFCLLSVQNVQDSSPDVEFFSL